MAPGDAVGVAGGSIFRRGVWITVAGLAVSAVVVLLALQRGIGLRRDATGAMAVAFAAWWIATSPWLLDSLGFIMSEQGRHLTQVAATGLLLTVVGASVRASIEGVRSALSARSGAGSGGRAAAGGDPIDLWPADRPPALDPAP